MYNEKHSEEMQTLRAGSTL